MGLRKEIEHAVNRVSAENGSNTPDFILADYLCGCLAAFDRATNAREKWYSRPPAMLPAPTIHELEAILAQSDSEAGTVEILPDGSVRASGE